MTQEQIFSKVQDIIVNKLDCAREDVTPETRLGNDLGVDSLDYIEMVLEVEKAFHIIVPDEQTYFKETVTVKEYCEELEKIINEQ